MTRPPLSQLLAELAEQTPAPEQLQGLLGGTWEVSASDPYYTDHVSTDAPGFAKVQLRFPGPKARAGAIVGFDLDPDPCVTADEIRAAIGRGAPSPARPGAPGGLRHEVVSRGEVRIHLSFERETGCLRQISVRHPPA